MKKLIAVATIAMAGLTIGGTAFAGENTGGPNPKPTPINNFGHAQSICAFSGQNDNPDGAVALPTPHIDPLEIGKTQNWGHTQANAKAEFDAAQFDAFKALRAPGTTCNGRTGIVAVVTGG